MSKVLELVEMVEEDVASQVTEFEEHEFVVDLDDLLTLTKIIRLQHETLKAYSELPNTMIPPDLRIENKGTTTIVTTEGSSKVYLVNKLAIQTLEETNRIAGGES